MPQLISFESLRMFNSKRFHYLIIAFIITGLSGMLIGSIYSDQGTTNIDSFLFIISAFNQFVFLFISFFYIISITDDYENHIFLMYKQYDIGLNKVVMGKILLNLLTSLASIVIFCGAAFFILGLNDGKVLFASIIEVSNAILFSVLCATTIALIFKKTAISFIINFFCFILFNVGNLAFHGILSPADVNGLPYSAIRILAERPIARDIELGNTFSILQESPFLTLLISGFLSCLLIFIFLIITLKRRNIFLKQEKIDG